MTMVTDMAHEIEAQARAAAEAKLMEAKSLLKWQNARPGGRVDPGPAHKYSITDKTLLERQNAGLGERVDPALAYKYSIQIEGVSIASFLECSGIGAEREVKTYQEGGVNDFVHQLPGRLKYTNIVLQHGITYSHELWNWFSTGLYDGKVLRVNLSIVLGNAEGLKVKHWDVLSAFPVKYTGPAFKSDSTEVAVETVELAHHGLRLNAETKTSIKSGR